MTRLDRKPAPPDHQAQGQIKSRWVALIVQQVALFAVGVAFVLGVRALTGRTLRNVQDPPGGFVLGADRQTKAAFVYGGGANIYINEWFGIKGEYRGYVYKQPDFGLDALNSDKFTHTAQPSVGIVFRF